MQKMLTLLLVVLLHRLDRASAASNFESLAVRQQLAALNRKTPRPRLHASDRWFWVLISAFWPNWRHALAIVKPATVIDWHGKGFRLFWTWRSRSAGAGYIKREPRWLLFVRANKTTICQGVDWAARYKHGAW